MPVNITIERTHARIYRGMTTELHEQRLQAVHDAVRASGARSVLDLGCGDGDFVTRLIRDTTISRIVGMDLSPDVLVRLRARLAASSPDVLTGRVELICGSMDESSMALTGFDCAVLIESIEHIELTRLSVIERVIFIEMHPRTVVITTPNAEFNPLLGIPYRQFRHPDHRFEWGRARFRKWAEGTARRNGYRVTCSDIAGYHPDFGGASQMAVFRSAGRGATPNPPRPSHHVSGA